MYSCARGASDHWGTDGRDKCANNLSLDSVITALGLGKGAALDVGANIGNHACWFAERFDKVLCVEPGEVAFNSTRGQSLRTQDTQCVGTSLRIGILRRGWRPGCGFRKNLGSSVVRKCGGEGQFRILRGDDFVSEVAGGNAHVEVVKIDVEGAKLKLCRV